MRRDHVLQFVLEAAQTPDFQGVTAQAVADALSIWRNDAAVELNKLVAEGKLRRVGKKNVRFFPASEETADIRPEPAVQEEPPQAEEETGQYRAFSGLVGADGSLTIDHVECNKTAQYVVAGVTQSDHLLLLHAPKCKVNEREDIEWKVSDLMNFGMTLRTYKDVAATPYFMKLYGFPMDV